MAEQILRVIKHCSLGTLSAVESSEVLQMLSQFEKLCLDIDGRYANDHELQFVDDDIQLFGLRMQTYQTLQLVEAAIVKQVEEKIRLLDPSFFQNGDKDISAKWRGDTVRVFRYATVAMLMNDPETLHKYFLLWFQTIMKAFGAQKSCDTTYAVMQEVVKQHLSPVQASLFNPILELTRQTLSKA